MPRPQRRRSRPATSDDTLRGRLEWLAFAAMVLTVYLVVPITA